MNRKYVIIGISAIVVLVALVSFLLINLFSVSPSVSSGQVSTDSGDVRLVYGAVPNDAVAVAKFAVAENWLSAVSDGKSPAGTYADFRESELYAFFKSLASGSGNGVELLRKSPLAVSIHYSGKNRVSALYSFYTGEGYAGLQDVLKAALPDASFTRLRSGILSVGNGTFYAASENGYVLFSDNSLVMESSLRHLESGNSIMDIKEFALLAKGNVVFPDMLYLNNQQAGKIFSGYGAYKSLKYAEFVSVFSTWSSFALHFDGVSISGEGDLLNTKGLRSYSHIFSNVKESGADFYSLLPSNTVFALRISTDPLNVYLDGYRGFVELNGSIADYNWIQSVVAKDSCPAPDKWIREVSPKEIILFSLPSGDSLTWGAAMRVKRDFDMAALISRRMARDNNVSVRPFRYKGYLGSIFGDMFRLVDDSYCIDYRDWTIAASRDVLDGFIKGNYSYFTLNDYLSATDAGKDALVPACLNMVVSLDRAKGFLPAFFNDRYSASVDSLLNAFNYSYLIFNVKPSESGLKSSFKIYADRMEKLPSPEPGRIPAGTVTGDTVLQINEGPFEVKNFVDGSTNYLKKTKSALQLLDSRKRPVWSIEFKTPLAGRVEQIDKYKNGKLQMLFCSGNRLYLVDRLGRYVKGYPVKLKKNVVLGPDVYDFRGDKSYAFTVLNSDNSISLYNVDGSYYPGWKDVQFNEKIVRLPELFKAGKEYYWIMRSSVCAYIYTLQGELVSRPSKVLIDRNTEVKVLSSSAVSVKCSDGKTYRLDLKSGEMKKER